MRLRTTTGLSVLALAIGIIGTGWLSTLTAGGPGPRPRHASTHRVASAAHHPARSAPPHRRSPVSAMQVHRAKADSFSASVKTPAALPVAPELVPLAMPGDSAQRWDELRGHLDGRVVLHLGIDGNGQVAAANLVESSGDPVLDAHALSSVRRWRFAVPADHPDGISGDLSMHFTSQGERIAQLP